MLKCKKCESTKVEVKEREFKNGTIHNEAICMDCSTHNGFLERTPPENFMLPFGKYKDKALSHVYKIDKEYILWVFENVKSRSLKNKIARLIENNKL